MAALLVAMAVMSIMMSVAMPVWKQSAQREREEELIFRGTQYTHAIGLFQHKYANAFPPTIDVLIQERFLRKKFKDPITNSDFQPLLQGQATPGSSTPGAYPSGAGPGAGGGGAGSGRTQTTAPSAGTPGRGMTSSTSPGTSTPGGISSGGLSPIGTPGAGGVGGVMGVVSKSKDKSIRLYNGRSHYNEWAFVFTPQQQTPGGGAPGSAVPGAVPGQPGGRPGGPGTGRPGGPGTGRPGGPGGPVGPGGMGRPTGPGGSNPFAPQPLFPRPGGRSGG